jgi:hypothetical protein
MGDALGKLLKLLDQVLPFLETAPPWLRVWIYVLIGLNFATIAGVSISYLISKEKRAESESSTNFSIESPKKDEIIPLGDTGRWVVTGKFPVIPAEKDIKHEVEIQVMRLQDNGKGDNVTVPQDGAPPLISTVQGLWRSESVLFMGAGKYEVTAIARFGTGTDFKSVTVTCSDKSSGYRQSILDDRSHRGAPPIVWPQPGAVSFSQIEPQAIEFQAQFEQQYLKQNDLPAALETVNLALNLVEPLLPSAPNDYNLQNYRAYMLKNYAMIMRDMGKTEEATRSLDEAWKMFSAILEQFPKDPGAWNGLGSVAMLRGDPQMALQYIDQALKIEPNYSYAKQDKETVLAQLKKQAR